MLILYSNSSVVRQVQEKVKLIHNSIRLKPPKNCLQLKISKDQENEVREFDSQASY